jgi:DegV family protein with EDD domain
VDISRREFYERLPEYDPPPTTSAPGLGAFVKAYERLAAEGATEILSIHISASLSAILNVAHSAAQAIRAARVTVFDSRQLTLGTGFLALAAASAAQAGHSMAEIVGLLKERVLRTYSFAALDTLEYLRRGGRMSRAQSSLGELLKIRPLLTMYDGEMTVERTRTFKRTLERLDTLVHSLAPLEELALLHANAREKAEGLWEHFRHLVPQVQRPFIVEVTPAIGAHVGPGGVGLVCVRAPQA